MDSTAGRRREKISTHLKKKLLWVLRARQADTGAGQTEKYKGHARGVISDRGQPDNNKVTQLGQKVWIYPLDTVAAPQHRTFLRYWDPKILCNEPLSSTLSVSWVFKLCGWVWAWAGIGSHGVNCAMSFVAAVVVFFKKCLCYPSIMYKFDLYNRPSRSLSAHWTMTNWFWTITYLALLLSRRIHQCD